MINIVICDDDIFYIEQIKALVEKYSPSDIEHSVKSYQSGEEFLDDINALKAIDIVFIDIEMKEITGIDTIKKLKEMQPDAIVLFVTSHSNYITDIFRLGAFQFLQKPIVAKDFTLDFNRAIEQYKRNHTKLEINLKDRIYCIEYSDIIFIEVQHKQITIFTRKDKIEMFGKIKDYEIKLRGFGFANCHKSILINLQHIELIDLNGVKLNGYSKILPISRGYKAELLSELNKYNMGKSL